MIGIPTQHGMVPLELAIRNPTQYKLVSQTTHQDLAILRRLVIGLVESHQMKSYGDWENIRAGGWDSDLFIDKIINVFSIDRFLNNNIEFDVDSVVSPRNLFMHLPGTAKSGVMFRWHKNAFSVSESYFIIGVLTAQSFFTGAGGRKSSIVSPTSAIFVPDKPTLFEQVLACTPYDYSRALFDSWELEQFDIAPITIEDGRCDISGEYGNIISEIGMVSKGKYPRLNNSLDPMVMYYKDKDNNDRQFEMSGKPTYSLYENIIRSLSAGTNLPSIVMQSITSAGIEDPKPPFSIAWYDCNQASIVSYKSFSTFFTKDILDYIESDLSIICNFMSRISDAIRECRNSFKEDNFIRQSEWDSINNDISNILYNYIGKIMDRQDADTISPVSETEEMELTKELQVSSKFPIDLSLLFV